MYSMSFEAQSTVLDTLTLHSYSKLFCKSAYDYDYMCGGHYA